MKDFAGKIAFITGGASGAGLGQAKVFSKAGMKVAIADVRQDALDNAVEELKEYGAKQEDILALKLDLTDRAAYAAVADKVEEVFGGPPHLLIQTAGVNTFGPAEASTFEDFDWVMGVCLGGVVNGLVILVPRMIKAYAHKTSFHVAATSSWGAFMAGPTTAPYAAAKSAVNSLMYSYSVALKPYGAGATVICPANIRSNICEAEKHRPAHLKNSGYNVTEDTIGLLKTIHSHGMDPIDLANWLKEGIENDQVLVVPYKESQEMLQRELQKVLNYSSVEGMKRQVELDKQAAEQIKKEKEARGDNWGPLPDVGFGKAKKDLDWVDESKKFN